jgi:Cu/Ag efflux pump CusA
MALALGAGSEAYAPLARAIIGGLGVSVVLTMFIVPAAFLVVYQKPEPLPPPPEEAESEAEEAAVAA